MNTSLKFFQEFIFDPHSRIYKHPEGMMINYQDGGESYIFESMKKIKDLSSHSQEFRSYIKDWPSRYHFSHKRINFLEALKEIFPPDADVLEIGSGCGTITRWLGEQFHTVDALEGDFSRAVITRYRTKDLDNVKVYCGNLLETGFNKKYDIITLIGSLEYLPFFDTEYNDPQKVCSAILTRLNDALKENGILLIAIENKFGAKYFSGCKEDHTGKEFEGIIGYPDKTQVTFSRNELESIISASGFTNYQFYHVFPDYKLTDTIIPETTEVLPLYPYNWISTPFEDYSGKFLYIFPDILFIKSVTDSGLLWQFSNSFIILISKTKNINLSGNWLIKKYNINDFSKPIFFHTITLGKNFESEKTGIKYFIQRSSLSGVNLFDEDDQFLFELTDNNFVPGKLLLFDFVNALFKKSPENNLKQVLRELHDNLLQNYSIGENDLEGYPSIKGDTVDYTFWNLIKSPDNTIEFIDRKWKSKKALPADFILFRNLFWIFDKISPFLKNKDKSSFIISMIKDIYPQYSEERLIVNLRFENAFQFFVTGENLHLSTDNLKQYNVIEQVVQNQERFVRIQDLQQTVTTKDLLIENLNDNVRNLQQTVTTKDLLIENLNDDIRDSQQKIADIEKSIIWQFTMKFHRKIIERILPQNTQRRKFYDLGRKGGKILVNDGFQVFHSSFKGYLHKNKKLNHYQLWIEKNETGQEDIRQFKKELHNFSYHPKISIVLPVWNTDEIWLRLAIESVISQIYNNWELCIVDGGSTKSHIQRVLNEYARRDSRINVKFLPENKGIAGNSNESLSLATGDFIGFLDHDDELSPYCFYEMVKLLNFKKNIDVIYTDNDKIDESGQRKDPFFKFDFSLPALLSTNYPFHFFLCRRSMVDAVGGLRYGFEGSQDYDLILRVIEKTKTENIGHIDQILYHWRTVRESTAQTSLAKPYAYEAGKVAIQDYLIRNHIHGSVNELAPGSYRVRKEIRGNPIVMIVVISGNKDSKKFIENINLLLQKTTYPISKIFISKKNDGLCFPDIQISEKNPLDILEEIVQKEKFDYMVFIDDTEDFNENFQKNPEWIEALIEHFPYFEAGVVGTGSLVFSNIICNVERPCGSIFCIKKEYMMAFFEHLRTVGDFDELQIMLSDFSEKMNVGNLYTPFSVGNIPNYRKISQYYSNFRSRKFFTKNMEFYLPLILSS
jgi:glycosyltransferase involved in cell wall biosynthesis/2-polyprenyl-3-methyl-5-hydroxy-6-metoxy-1,4-benzoquinol methylase